MNEIELDRWTGDVVLADGGTVHVRPIQPDDAARLVAFHERLSDTTIHFRFFSYRRHLTDADVERFTVVDHHDRFALVAQLGDDLIAVARYDREPDTSRAEVAFVVRDDHQGRGLGTLLLEHLAAAALERGITEFTAEVLPENRRMLQVFREAGYQVTSSLDAGVVEVRFPIAPTESSRAIIEERDRVATTRSVGRILAPRSIAVLGASRRRDTVGHELFRNLLTGGFNGPVYPVNPAGTFVASVRAYARLSEVPDDVDLAVVCVPAAEVPAAVEDCAAKGVAGLVIISAGFGETGPDGAAAERDVVRLAHRHGMRVIGPNCVGVLNTDPDVRMNATFSPYSSTPGTLGFLSQSGALGIAVLQRAEALGVGVSAFVSVGNKADISGNDLLQYWEQDERTRVVLLYLESFGNPRRFARIARRVSRQKPIVAVKSGRSEAGTRAASSHTAALSSPDAAVDALFRQTGVIRVDSLEQLLDVAQVLESQPLPAGDRVVIVGNSGGPAILAADACGGAGLQVPELTEATQRELRSFLPPASAVGNPVDMTAAASAEQYERAVTLALADPNVDAAVVVFTPVLIAPTDDVVAAVARAAAARTKPVVGNFLTVPPGVAGAGDARIPAFASPESAVIALGLAARYAAWRRRPEGSVPDLPGLDAHAARRLVDAVLADAPGGRWLDGDEATRLLGSYGVPIAPSELAGDADAAVAAAGRLGYPVALKTAAPDVVHKTDVGGVHLDLGDEQAVREAFAAVTTAVDAPGAGAVVQRMVEPGVETIVGVVHDASFGPLLMFGLGGVATELLADRAFRVLPLTDLDARELIRSVRASPLLFGYRGAPAVDTDALEDLLLRVARLADDVPELAEMDLNPVIAAPGGVTAVDAKVRLAPVPDRPDPWLRRLRA